MRFNLTIINEHQQILLIASIFFFFFFLVFITKKVAGSFFPFFDIRLKVKLVCFSFFAYRVSLFVFQYSNTGRISNFDIRNRILTFEPGPNI